MRLSQLFTGLFLLVAGLSAAQPELRQKGGNSGLQHLAWGNPQTVSMTTTEQRSFLWFQGAEYDAAQHFLPVYSHRFKLDGGNNSATAQLNDAVYEPLDEASLKVLNNDYSGIANEVTLNTQVGYDRKEPYAMISFVPLRKNASTGKIEKLVSFSLSVQGQSTGRMAAASVARTYASASVLASGTWYRVGVANTGIYKLDYNFLVNTLKIDPSQVDPRRIRLFGNGRGMLPFQNSAPHYDDLKEYAIVVQGESDGTLDPADYVLFYGVSPNTWKKYNTPVDTFFHHQVHQYSDTTYYFLTFDKGTGLGKRVQPQASSSQVATKQVTSFDDYQYHEADLENLIKSGREWYGEKFDILTSYSFPFTFADIDMSQQSYVKVDLVSRDNYTHNYTIDISSGSANTSTTLGVGSVSLGCYYCDYVAGGNKGTPFTPGGNVITVTVTKQDAAAVGWLNYIEVNARRHLNMSSGQLAFRDHLSTGSGNVAQYTISNVQNGTLVWDVTDIDDVYAQSATLNGSNLTFTLPSDTMKEFVAFDGTNFMTPAAFGSVANQNLHGLPQTNFIIVAHPKFLSEANELAQIHATNDNLTSVVVTPQQIYNEFSSGAQDISAIRDFIKMFYDRATVPADMPRYVLLFGDGSYDNKRRLGGNTNYIPTFQNANSYSPTESYTSDEFYGLLDDSEGPWDTGGDVGFLDIGIGRFPVQTNDEARGVIDKVRKYISKQPPQLTVSSCNNGDCSPFGDWRNWLGFIGDDEDADVHVSQSNDLATYVDTLYDNYNIDKIFLDAYQEEHTPGGDRYPSVQEAIDNRVQKGCLILNYTGHGGEVGLAHERIVEVTQINGWKNLCNLPLFVTATCEFSRFDDPARTSAGEYVLLNKDGGGIGLFTTVRLVYSTPNFTLNMEFYRHVFEELNGEMPRIGDVYRLTKANAGNNTNNRNFTLLGDPALRLAYPVHNVVTTEINGHAINISQPDTAKALSLVTVKGFVADENGNKITTYNGVIYPTVFDKPATINTLSNDGPSLSPVFAYKLQHNILYKGKVSVTNGDFDFSFIVPKDISYWYGPGRISYYADNGDEDASGAFENFIVGGSNPNAPLDVTGPLVRLFMNDSAFVSGGTTNESPKLYALVKDDNGVNTVGNGIGHDIVATLDNNNEKAFVLNDYYRADLNSYKSGVILYPFSELTEGTHTLSLKVWDVYNNSATSNTEFVVAKSAEMALNHVLNYPNPFSTHTQFFFENNRCCEEFDVQIQVFTVSGKLVKTINQPVYNEGFRSAPIDWDGRDDYGDKIGKGVYVYRIRVRSTDGTTAEKFEKLVILN